MLDWNFILKIAFGFAFFAFLFIILGYHLLIAYLDPCAFSLTLGVCKP